MTAPRTISLFGATGSVGTSTLDLLARGGDAYRVLAVTANCDVEALARIAIAHEAQVAVIADESRDRKSVV